MCDRQYTLNMSMKIGETSNCRNIRSLSWIKFASEMQVSLDDLKNLAQGLIQAIKNHKTELLTSHTNLYGEQKEYSALDREIDLNITMLVKSLDIEYPPGQVANSP